jgi:hypothetical protein
VSCEIRVKRRPGIPEGLPGLVTSTWNVILGENEVPEQFALLRMTALTSQNSNCCRRYWLRWWALDS